MSLVLALSWFVASNRCALGLMTVEGTDASRHEVSQAGHEDQDHDEGCPDEPTGHHHKGSKSGGGGESCCCQSINIATFEAAKRFSCDPEAYALQAYLAWFVNAAAFEFHSDDHSLFEIDTGPPPGFVSFAESVLQRSILAHAPPSLA